MTGEKCPGCGRLSDDDDCDCTPLTCPTCGKAVVWFGDNEGTDPCKHVVALGGVGYDNTEWRSKEYERMFEKYWEKHSDQPDEDDESSEDTFDSVEEALEHFAEETSLDYVLHDNGLSGHAAIGIYVLFMNETAKRRKTKA